MFSRGEGMFENKATDAPVKFTRQMQQNKSSSARLCLLEGSVVEVSSMHLHAVHGLMDTLPFFLAPGNLCGRDSPHCRSYVAQSSFL